ncbi:MAG TPA: glycosyltransferase family 2 protein [Noviherbaspirillum sp.]
MHRESLTHEAPLVTVIIPCFNQGRYLAEAISSARLAYEGPLEVIVVDDGSTDPKTDRWLREAEAMGGYVHVIRQQNRGLSGARNAGLRAASGDYVQFLDTDDLIIPGKLDAQMAHFMVSSGLDVSVSNFLLCDDRRNAFSKPDEAIAQFALSLDDFLFKWERGFVIPIHCGLFRRAALGDAPFDEEARAKEDWLFWCTLVSKGARLAYVSGHWAIYRQHADSMRRSYVAMGKSWIKAALKVDQLVADKHPGFFHSAVEWFNQCYRAHPSYAEEIRARLSPPNGNVPETVAAVSPAFDLQNEVQKLARALHRLTLAPAAPLISVVIPAYNHFEHLLECLASLGTQGEVNFEVVCVDDASPDARVGALLEALADRLHGMRVLRHARNKGISATQNAAVEMARGRFIAFLDCDDALEPGALERVAAQIGRDHDVDYVFSDRLDVDATGALIRQAKYGGYDNIIPGDDRSVRDDLLDGMVASHLKVIRRDTYLAVGGTNNHYSGCQDWELALKIAEQGRFAYIPQALYRHRIHANSVTSSDQVAQFRKTNQLRRIYGQRWLSPYGAELTMKQLLTSLSPSSDDVIWFTGRKALPTLAELKSAWSRGMTCCFDLRGTFDLAIVNFLREYNSYFNRILWDDPAVPGALLGYLWSDQIVANAAHPTGRNGQSASVGVAR